VILADGKSVVGRSSLVVGQISLLLAMWANA
jgi:hypothetical protein